MNTEIAFRIAGGLALAALLAGGWFPERAVASGDGDRAQPAIPTNTGREAASPKGGDSTEDNSTTLEDVFPWTGEQLYYSLRVNGAEALRGAIRVGDLRRKGENPYVPVGLSVHSFGFFDDIYPVDDGGDTYLDPVSMHPYRSEKRFRESGNVRSYVVEYDRDQFTARVEKSRPDRERTFENAIPRTTHDMITWIYHLRRRPIERGATYQYFIYDGWKLSDVRLEVVGKKEILTPAGWFKAWKLRFVRKIVKSKRHEQAGRRTAPVLHLVDPSDHEGFLWLSRDENHLPIRITIPTKFGSGEAVLMEYDRPEHQ